MKINPQAVINAGMLSSQASGGGIQIGTNVPCGIPNFHRFASTQERDEYFTNHLADLTRLQTIIVCGSDLQLWTGQSVPEAYEAQHWSTMTWVIQGQQGVAGSDGQDGVGIKNITAQVDPNSPDTWKLTFTLTDNNVKEVTYPIPELLATLSDDIDDLRVRFGSRPISVDDMDDKIDQGRYAFNELTHNKPPSMNTGSIDVYHFDGAVMQMAYDENGSRATRHKPTANPWTAWQVVVEGSNGGGDIGESVILASLNHRFARMSPDIKNANDFLEQGRFCYSSRTANIPAGATSGTLDVYACSTHVYQHMTDISGTSWNRHAVKEENSWSDWHLSGFGGGRHFPRLASAYTTGHKFTEDTRKSSFYIKWKYAIHDNYGCTEPLVTDPSEEANRLDWWVCPKSGSYEMTLLFNVSYIKTPATIPPMFVVKAWHRKLDGTETEVASFNMVSESGKKVQSTKKAKLLLDNFVVGDKIRWQVIAAGAQWSAEDNPDASLTPFRTMLYVDEIGYDTAKRVADLAFTTWGAFHAKQGYAASVGGDTSGNARINAVKWASEIVDVQKNQG